MSKKYPKLSVVIPTRERADTLMYALKTVTSQVYDNLEIIVSDNASNDCTREIVTAIDDGRIKYTNTGNRVGMSENWEHGLSLVTGDYVMFLGDDDGLLPNACSDVAELLVKTGAKAVIWSKPDYTWPRVAHAPNILSLKCSSGLVELQGDILLKEVAAGRTSYGRLPVIYSGFVSVASIDEIKSLTNKFFQCVTPDVYSGIVFASMFKTYLYSLRPFSINGGSQHSNGINQVDSKSKLAKFFYSESGVAIDKDFPVIPGSISSCIAEAFSQAKRRNLVGSNKLNQDRYYLNIYLDLIAQPSSVMTPGLKILTGLKLPMNLRTKANNQLMSEANDNCSGKVGVSVRGDVAIPLDDGVLRIDCEKFNVNNSFDACQLVGRLIGDYKMPSNIIKAGYFAYVLLAFRRKVVSIFSKYSLPF